jgi:hypothetical protein
MYDCSVATGEPTHPHAVIDRLDLARGYEVCGRFADAVPHRWELLAHYRNLGDTKRADFQAERLARDLTASASELGHRGPHRSHRRNNPAWLSNP